MDFSSSGQSDVTISQLYSSEIQLINAIELVDWDIDEGQLLVCEACGFVGCKSGDWVSLRFADPLILITPAFISYTDSDEARREYSPPWYIRTRGIPYFELETYELLRTQNVSFPSVSNIRKLSMKEAVLTFQWEAPYQVFDRAPKPVIYQGDLIIAASEGEPSEIIRSIEEYASANISNEQKVSLHSLGNSEQVVSLYLDTPGFLEWRAVAFSDNGLKLILDSKHMIVSEQTI